MPHSVSLIDLISAAIGVQALLLCLVTFRGWFSPSLETVFSGRPHRADEWMVMAVASGFGGYVLNVGYWDLYYLLRAYGSPWATEVLSHGGWVNILTRYLPLIVSSYCFAMASWLSSGRRGTNPKRILCLTALPAAAIALGGLF